VLYKPKDIVAGDFYWMHTSSSNDDDATEDASQNEQSPVLFAAADCIGHGLPGALVSVVCYNALNRAVRKFRLGDPGQILERTREIVEAEFADSYQEVKDGMDIALVRLAGRELQYSGADNPLWIARKGATLIEEIKANKQPSGKDIRNIPFTAHSVQLDAGDTVYLFSDGYSDQFGGAVIGGKKFKSSNFKKLLTSI
jgi:serine phosphatase RsbU (regulator of sigma subunit)